MKGPVRLCSVLHLRGDKDELSVPVPQRELEQLLGDLLPVHGVQEHVPLVQAPAHTQVMLKQPVMVSRGLLASYLPT